MNRYRFHYPALCWLHLSMILALLLAPFIGVAQAAPVLPSTPPTEADRVPLPVETPQPPPLSSAGVATAETLSTPNCALLDDPATREMMSGALETALLHACGRDEELLQVAAPLAPRPLAPAALGDDVLVNDPTGELTSTTQSGAVVAYNDDTGVLCAAYNDSYHGIVQGTGFTGFSSSSDGGATWTDHSSLGDANSYGYPALAWRRADGHFYLATLYSSGMGLWDMGDGCDAATWVGMIHTSSNDDKEMLAVDNNPASPYYGRLYTAWTEFVGGSGYIKATASDNAVTWSTPITVSVNTPASGAWPAVDPVTGDVYVAWAHWDVYPDGPIDVEIARSADGGATWNPLANPMSDQVNPRDATASTTCGRPALNGDIRHSPYPQIAVDQHSVLHAVYSYDPDGYNYGDVVNVYYRRSTDQGVSWEDEIRVNDNWSWTDQFFPTLAVGETGVVGVFWYDRRLDSANVMYDRYMALSRDGGLTFEANQRVSDESSPVVLDPSLAPCYHGDYDGAAAGGGYFYTVWGDDRRGDADVWSDTEPYFWNSLFGTVYDESTMHGVEGAHVETIHTPTGIPFSAVTDASGYYAMSLPGDETYAATAQAYGYAPNTVAAMVDAGGGRADIPLTPVAFWSISGAVLDASTGYPVYAHITVTGDPLDPPAPTNETWSDPFTGIYSLPDLAAAIPYTLTFEAEGYITLVYFAGELDAHLFNPDLFLQPDLVACTAPGYELTPPCQSVAGAVLQPSPLETEGCPCAEQTHTLFFANHAGFDDEVLLSYTTSAGASAELPTSLGVVPDTGVRPFDARVQIDRGVALNAPVYVTVTAYLASNPAISDTMVIEKRAALLEAPWEWEEDAPVAAFYRGAGATLDDAAGAGAYVIGGQSGVGAHGDTARYRPDVGWQTLDDKPTPAANIDPAELNGKIYVAGGYNSGVYLSVVEVLDPAQPAGFQWTTLTSSLPISTSAGAMAAACGKVYLIGGNPNTDVATHTVYMYDPANPGGGWNPVAPMPQTQRYASAVTARGLIFAVGDWDTGNLVQVYDCATDTWLPGYPQLNVGREAPGTVVIQNRYIVAYGGAPAWSFSGQPDVEYLDLDNLAAGWQAGPPMAQGRMGPGGGIAGGRLIAIGGYSASWEPTNTAESIAFCPECDCGVDIAKTGPDWAYTGDVVPYTIVITRPNWLTGTATLIDALPAGVDFAGGLSASSGNAWYSDTARAVYWTRPMGAYSGTGAGSELEVFTNTWATSAVGLAYNPSVGYTRYVHESGAPPNIHDVAYPVPHPVLHSFSLSEMNPGWPTTQNWRSGIGYDAATGHYFLTDYGGGGSRNDNFVEIDASGRVINGWETAGTSNDSYDGTAINNILDIAVVSGSPTRYFATALFDGGLVYELDLLKAGQFVTDTWGKVMTCTVPGITDTAGIDYDAQNGVLYHSDWDSNAIVVTDLRCNVLETFTCGAPTAQNSGVTFIEGQWPPEVWTMDHSNNTTTRCEAVGREPLPEVVTITFNVTVTAPASTTIANKAILTYESPGYLPSPSILHLRTTDTASSVQRTLDELGYTYDSIYAIDWTGIDFTPYDVVIIGMDGGTVGVASVQKIRTDVIDQGKRVIFLGGTSWLDFVDGVNQYLVANNTALYTWVQTASPHFTLVDPAHPLAQGLPSSLDFVTSGARNYQLRATDPAMEVVAQNGDGAASYLRKTYPGGGELTWFIHSAAGSYWTNPTDFQLLQRLIGNAMPHEREAVARHAFHVAPRTALTWTEEIYVNGNYLGRYDEGPFTVVPSDDVQLVDRLDYVGREPLFVQLTEDWGGYPVTLTGEYHTRGVFVDGDWYVTLLPDTSARLVKTLHITDAVPVVITERLYPDGMPMEERAVAFEPPTFSKDGPTVAYHGQIVAYTLTLDTQDALFGSLRLTDTLPAGVEYAYGLNASYGNAWYDLPTHAVYWTNAPASSLTRRATLGLAAPTEARSETGLSDVGPLSAQTLSYTPTPPFPHTPILPHAPSATWFPAAPLPTGRVRYAHAQCPGEPNRFYVISGVPTGAAESAWRYDADTDTWTTLAPIPSPVEGPSAACYQGRIYVAGGGGRNQFYIYDIARDIWTEGPTLPRNVWGAAMGAWDGRLFLAGGDNDFFAGGASNQVNVYDIAVGSWSMLGATMPVSVSAPGWTQVSEYLYVVGGWGDDATHNITATLRYNMAWDYWETGPTFTSARADFPLAATDQYLYAIGGDANGGGFFDAVTLTERLDYINWYIAAWTDIGDPLPAALSAYNGSFCTMAKSGGEIWSVGGLTAGWVYTSTNQYRPSEPCVAIPPTLTLTFNVLVTAGADERVTNTAALDFHGYVLTATSAFEVPLPGWQKQVNGQPWTPGLVVTAQASDTVTVTDVISTASAFTLRETWDLDRLELIGYVTPTFGTVTPYPWTEAPAAPFAYTRFDAEYSYATGHVYFLGGRLSNSGTDGSVWGFDPATGVYTDTGVDMPFPVSNYNIARLTDSGGDEVLVTFGGRLDNGVITNVVQGFYPASGMTVTFDADPYPAATSPGGVTVVGNVAYVFGGFDGSVVISNTYILDITAPAGSRWTAGPPLNQARSYIGAAVVDGVIYAIGGDDYIGGSLVALTITEKLDPAAGSPAWDDAGVAEMPIACGEMQAFGLDADAPYPLAGSVIVAGCGQWPGEIAESLRYDVASDTWDVAFSDLNQARRNHAGAFIPAGAGSGRPGLWVWGGRQGSDSNVLDVVEFYPLTVGILSWQVPAGTTQPLTLTKFFHVEPCTCTETLLDENLAIGGWSEARVVEFRQTNRIYLPLILKNS